MCTHQHFLNRKFVIKMFKLGYNVESVWKQLFHWLWWQKVNDLYTRFETVDGRLMDVTLIVKCSKICNDGANAKLLVTCCFPHNCGFFDIKFVETMVLPTPVFVEIPTSHQYREHQMCCVISGIITILRCCYWISHPVLDNICLMSIFHIVFSHTVPLSISTWLRSLFIFMYNV